MNTSGGYSPKELHFDKEAREKLISGIKKIARCVKSTLGPLGETVLIESQEHLRGITVTKDGVTVAKSISLLDPVENLAVRMMKEAAEKTATHAGDGTTTSIVLTEAIVLNAIKEFDPMRGQVQNVSDKTEVIREINTVKDIIINELSNIAVQVDDEKLLDVATISCNNDKELGKIIADTYKAVGKDGIVTIEKSDDSKTYSQTTQGIKVDRGYSSHLFINDQKKDQCILDDVHVLVCDAEINNILSIENILKPIINQNKKLLIIAPCSQNVINTLAANVMKNNLKLCTIIPPNFGYKQQELMNDIALSVGATYFSESTGDDLSLITFEDLGKAKKIIVSKDETVIVKDSEIDNDDKVKERVDQLWEQHKITKSKADKEFIKQRIASLTGGIGVIYVGGNTDLEQKELYDRVDDAVCAVRSALEEGILPGGGVAYLMCTDMLNKSYIKTKSKSRKTAIAVLLDVLHEPCNTILSNAGIARDKQHKYVSWDTENKVWEGCNVKTKDRGDMIKMGIIDPLKVTKEALTNAVSVATTILSTNAIITMARSYEATRDILLKK